MTSIVSIVAAFMATFMLVFGYLTYSEPDPVDAPEAVVSEVDR